MNPRAEQQYQLAIKYCYGNGVPQDMKKAVEHLKLAAEPGWGLGDHGHVESQYILAMWCFENKQIVAGGMTKDQAVQEGVKYLKFAARQGHIRAQGMLGEIFFTGITPHCQDDDSDSDNDIDEDYRAEKGELVYQFLKLKRKANKLFKSRYIIKPDLEEARKIFEFAANKGLAFAQFYLGECYAFGRGVKKDLLKAIEFYLYANQKNCDDARKRLNKFHEDHKDDVRVVLEKEVRRLNLNYDEYFYTCYYKNEPYSDKRTLLRKEEKSLEGLVNSLIKLVRNSIKANVSSEPNSALKQYYVALECHRESEGEEAHSHVENRGFGYKKAIELWEIAAHKGHAGAQVALGHCYQEGIGVAVDKAKSVDYYQRARSQGFKDTFSVHFEDYSNEIYTNPLLKFRDPSIRVDLTHSIDLKESKEKAEMSHDDYVAVVTFHEKSKNEATYGSNKIVDHDDGGWVEIYQASTQRLISILKVHIYGIQHVIFSKNGRKILSVSEDTIGLWDVGTGGCIKVFQEHKGLTCIALNTEGNQIILGSNKNLHLWDERGQCLRTFEGHTDAVSSVTFSSNGLHIFSGSRDGKIRQWDVKAGICLKVFDSGMHHLSALSEDEQRFVSTNNMEMRLWDINSGACLQTFKFDKEISTSVVAFSPDNRQILSGDTSGMVYLWDVNTGKCCQIFKGHLPYCKKEQYSARVTGVAFVPNAPEQVVSGSLDHTLRLWDVKTGKCLRVIGGFYGPIFNIIAPREFHAAQFQDNLVPSSILTSTPSEDTKELKESADITDKNDGWILIAKREKMQENIADKFRYWWEAIHPFSKKRIAILNNNPIVFNNIILNIVHNTVQVWDMRTGRQIQSIPYSGGWPIALDNKARYLAIAEKNSDEIRIWNLKTGLCVSTIKKPGCCGSIGSIVFSEDSHQILVACFLSQDMRENVFLWNVETGQCIKIFRAYIYPRNSFFISSHHVVFVGPYHDCPVSLWNVFTGQCIQKFDVDNVNMDGYNFEIVSYNSNSRQLVSVSDMGKICLWSVDTGTVLKTFKMSIKEDHPKHITWVNFCDDNKHIVSGLSNGEILFWDINTVNCIMKIEGLGGEVCGYIRSIIPIMSLPSIVPTNIGIKNQETAILIPTTKQDEKVRAVVASENAQGSKKPDIIDWRKYENLGEGDFDQQKSLLQKEVQQAQERFRQWSENLAQGKQTQIPKKLEEIACAYQKHPEIKVLGEHAQQLFEQYDVRFNLQKSTGFSDHELELKEIIEQQRKLQEQLDRQRQIWQDQTKQNLGLLRKIKELEESFLPLRLEYEQRQRILEAQKKIFSNPQMKIFYLRVQVKLNQIFCACMVVGSGKVDKKDDMINLGIKLVDKILDKLTFGVASIITTGINEAYNRREIKKDTKVSENYVISVANCEAMVEKIARLLTIRYEEQIQELTVPGEESLSDKITFSKNANGGAETLGDCAVARILNALQNEEVKANHELAEQLVNWVFKSQVKQGFLGFTNKAVATGKNLDWNDDGVLQRSGIKVAVDSKIVERYKGMKQCNRPDKYFYRWGTIEEVRDLRLVKHIQSKEESTMSSPALNRQVQNLVHEQKIYVERRELHDKQQHAQIDSLMRQIEGLENERKADKEVFQRQIEDLQKQLTRLSLIALHSGSASATPSVYVLHAAPAVLSRAPASPQSIQENAISIEGRANTRISS